MTPASFEVYAQQTCMFVKHYAKDPLLMAQMQDKLRQLEQQDLLTMTPFEVYFNCERVPAHCPSLLCPSNRELLSAFASTLHEGHSFNALLRSLRPAPVT